MTAAGFKVRHIRSEQSIGDRLKRARVRRKVSVADVEEATRIRAKFILALESDSWDQIPSEVYGRGYLESYLDFLKIPKEAVMRQYDRERALYARNCQDGPVALSPQGRLRIPRFVLTPRAFVLTVLVAGVVTFGGLITTQLRAFTSAPYLELAQVAEAKGEASNLVVSTDHVTITGKTAVGARLTVNGDEAGVDDDGNFREPVKVSKGVNAVVVEAISPTGKKTSEVLTVIVK